MTTTRFRTLHLSPRWPLALTLSALVVALAPIKEAAAWEHIRDCGPSWDLSEGPN